MQTLGTGAHLHVVALVALVDAALVLQQQRRRTLEALVLGWTGARLARGVARVAVAVFVVLRWKEGKK